MKRGLYFLIPCGTLIFIFISTSLFSYTTPVGSILHSVMFQSVLAILSCVITFTIKWERKLCKHFSKREKTLLLVCIAVLVLTNLPFNIGQPNMMFNDPIAVLLTSVFFFRIENMSLTSQPDYHLALMLDSQPIFPFLLVAFHFIIVYCISYQILKILTNDKQTSATI